MVYRLRNLDIADRGYTIIHPRTHKKTRAMITWDQFYPFALITVLMSIIGSGMAAYSKQYSKVAVYCASVGIFILSVFICGLWISLQRPPLRTMGETRLWYSFFMLLTGLFTYCRWKYRWILPYSTLMATIFIVINWVRPEIHDQSLMPALQSIWFIPHVTIYMFSYSILGCAFILAIYMLITNKRQIMGPTDNLIYIGIALFSVGMLTGSLWAKEAWGHFWSWDPKETWAAITWLLYLSYLHLRLTKQKHWKLQCWIIIIAFIALQMCWYGVNYLPSAQESIHLYNRN